MDIIKTLDNNEDSGHTGRRKEIMRSQQLLIINIILGVVIVVGAVMFVSKSGLSLPFSLPFGGKESGVSSGYQAVFLSNNQVYFGKVTGMDGQFPTITEVYYLRVTQALQPGAAGAAESVKVEKGKAAAPAAAPQNELSLIKLGNEIHGPTDAIKVNRDHVIFVEDLKDDSKVVRAIKDYKEKNK